MLHMASRNAAVLLDRDPTPAIPRGLAAPPRLLDRPAALETLAGG